MSWSKKNKSKLLHLTQQFCYGEYIITKGKNLYTLSSGSLVESFQNIIQNYDKLIYGSYFLEFVEKVSEKENKNVYLLALLLKTLYVLDSEFVKFDLLKIVFDFKIISLIGYTPQVLRCVKCGNTNFNGSFFLMKMEDFYAIYAQMVKLILTIMKYNFYRQLGI